MGPLPIGDYTAPPGLKIDELGTALPFPFDSGD
jgi:hypothetical protein